MTHALRGRPADASEPVDGVSEQVKDSSGGVADARNAGYAGVAPVLAAALLWGTVGPAQVLAESSASPVAVGACRMLLGGLVLGAFTARLPGLRTLWRPGVRGPMAVSILVTAAFQACFLAAVAKAGAALATAAAFGTVPVVAGICTYALTGERLSRAWWAGTPCAIVGIALLLVPGSSGRADPAGILLAVVAGTSFGVYITMTKRIADRGADTRSAAPVSVVCAGLLVSPVLFVAPEGLTEPRTLLLVGWLALATTALGYLLFTRGITRISAATAGTLSLAEPLVATVLGLVLLGERWSPVAGAGAVLLLAGLVVVSVPAPTRRPRTPAPAPNAVPPTRIRPAAGRVPSAPARRAPEPHDRNTPG
ncbi:DMT family transporter [Streptomyces sp. NPDC088745]|uniref:DMT family transporter n=1 Tax=Streptomyces sp. NPDC088745 TaxID=3365884 RepID=UPI00382A7B70